MDLPQFHFISGLPRSGSTLLAAILRQNPRFHAAMMSPVAGLCDGLLRQSMAGSEYAALLSPEQRRNVVRGVFEGYYRDRLDKELIFDTSRMWCGRMGLLHDQFPKAKVIACVRNVAWIMDSLERRYRTDPYEFTRLFNDDTERNSVYSRVDTLGQRNRLVGYAWTVLREAFYGPYARALLVVDYDTLVQAPQRVMELVYGFIGEPAYAHDFERLAYESNGFDQDLGTPGMHTVRPRVAAESRRTILPPDLFDQYADMAFWRKAKDSEANVITQKNDNGD